MTTPRDHCGVCARERCVCNAREDREMRRERFGGSYRALVERLEERQAERREELSRELDSVRAEVRRLSSAHRRLRKKRDKARRVSHFWWRTWNISDKNSRHLTRHVQANMTASRCDRLMLELSVTLGRLGDWQRTLTAATGGKPTNRTTGTCTT